MTTPGSALLDLHRPAASGSTASAAAAAATATPASKDVAGYDSYVDTGLLAMLEASASAAQDQQVDIPPALSPAATSASGESGAEEVGSAERRAEAHSPTRPPHTPPAWTASQYLTGTAWF